MTSSEWTVSQAQTEDAELLARLHAKSFEVAYTTDDVERNARVSAAAQEFLSEERIELRGQLILRAMVNDDEEFYYTASKNEEPVGLISGWKVGDEQELGALYVHPDYFGTGVSKALVGSFIEWCDPDHPVELGVVEFNQRAQRFYRKMGFQAIGSRQAYYDFLPEITMIRSPGGSNEV